MLFRLQKDYKTIFETLIISHLDESFDTVIIIFDEVFLVGGLQDPAGQVSHQQQCVQGELLGSESSKELLITLIQKQEMGQNLNF